MHQFRVNRSRFALLTVGIWLAGCSSGALDDGSDGSGGNGATAGTGNVSGSPGSSGSTTGGAPATGAGEFPCDVQALLATKCLSCHRADPPGSLLSAADFKRPSKSTPGQTVGQVALARATATNAMRMPPAPLEALTASELAALKAWVDAGAPVTTCGETPVPTGPDPYDTPVVCSSMQQWTGGNRESPQMRPGGACISCHREEGEGPLFAIAGTLYQTAHEPDDCNGVSGSSSGAQVVVTDANGNEHTLKVNSAGNFFLETSNFAFPYQAKVVYQGKERVMVEAQKNGDCNDCHTEAGRENAPGRIFLP